MDLISHALLGFVLGRGLPLQDKKMRILLVVSCVFPDIDSVSLIAGWDSFFQVHRGPLHSLFGVIVFSVAIAIVYTVVMRLSARDFVLIGLLCVGGSLSHVALDLLTPWSLPVLWPLSSEKVAYDLTYFFDPIFFAVLLSASVFMVFKRNAVQVIMVAVVLLLSMNFGVRYYERDAAVEMVTISADAEVVTLPTLRPDRWWIIVKIPFENGYTYQIYSVDSFHQKVLTTTTVESFVHCDLSEPPLDSPEKVIGYSKGDQRVTAFIEMCRLPAVEVTFVEGVWDVFWYDVYTELFGGVSRGIRVKIEIDGTILGSELEFQA